MFVWLCVLLFRRGKQGVSDHPGVVMILYKDKVHVILPRQNKIGNSVDMIFSRVLPANWSSAYIDTYSLQISGTAIDQSEHADDHYIG